MGNTHYEKYKDTIKRVARRNYRKRIVLLNEFLADKFCKHCGESETVCLKFYPHDSEIRKITLCFPMYFPSGFLQTQESLYFPQIFLQSGTTRVYKRFPLFHPRSPTDSPQIPGLVFGDPPRVTHGEPLQKEMLLPKTIYEILLHV